MNRVLLSIGLLMTLTLSGCIAGDDDAPATDSATMDATPATNTTGVGVETYTGTSGNAITTPAVSITNGGTYEFPLNQTSDNITGWTLELTWDANPESDSLDLWIRETGDFAIDPTNPALAENLINSQPALKATGTSPLRLAFTPSDINAEAEHSILIRAASPAGVALEQPFELKVATFDGVPHDPEYAF